MGSVRTGGTSGTVEAGSGHVGIVGAVWDIEAPGPNVTMFGHRGGWKWMMDGRMEEKDIGEGEERREKEEESEGKEGKRERG